MNNYELTTNDFNYYHIHRYKKKFTWKAFKKFGYVKGQILCEKYDIILTDYRTRNEKIYDFVIKLSKWIKGILFKKRPKRRSKKDYRKLIFGP